MSFYYSYSPFTGGKLSSPVLAANGSAAAPSYAFSSDTATGMYLASSGNLALAASGQVVLTAQKATGAFPQIGIGTAPIAGYTLVMKSPTNDASTFAQLWLDSLGGTLAWVRGNGQVFGQFFSTGGGSAVGPSVSVNGNGGMYSPANNQIALAAGGVQALLLDASQNATFAGTIKTQNAATIRSGTGIPASALGAQGDIFLRTDGTAGNNLYVKTNGTTWTPVAGV